jgi:hypothetical protein
MAAASWAAMSTPLDSRNSRLALAMAIQALLLEEVADDELDTGRDGGARVARQGSYSRIGSAAQLLQECSADGSGRPGDHDDLAHQRRPSAEARNTGPFGAKLLNIGPRGQNSVAPRCHATARPNTWTAGTTAAYAARRSPGAMTVTPLVEV